MGGHSSIAAGLTGDKMPPACPPVRGLTHDSLVTFTNSESGRLFGFSNGMSED